MGVLPPKGVLPPRGGTPLGGASSQGGASSRGLLPQGGVLPPRGCFLPGRVLPPRGWVLPPGGVLPPGEVPGGDPPGWLLLWAVRILLECILVSNYYHPQRSYGKGNVFTSMCQEFCPREGSVFQRALGQTPPPPGRHSPGRHHPYGKHPPPRKLTI